ncbi:uncharacterized protein LOC126905591 isoform X2 [Daktulosphaira vitifoliae]|uniref:uncharacterized protein LOC126905591 isoform X2 n=1 Tax=Daktulosphaira vitifoliae TaxID=58002 RepID=UPI0021A9B81E|nr:uncharacterized protein LOC126905591 isoform X2 [Daktulosphaira vitifoliae]
MNFLTFIIYLIFICNTYKAWSMSYDQLKGVDKNILTTAWRFILPRKIFEEKLFDYGINKENMNTVFTTFKRAESPLTPYESISVMGDLKQFFDNINTSVKQLKSNEKTNNKIQQKDDAFYISNTYKGYKPSDNIKNFVKIDNRETFHGSNSHDPAILWTGLGKKKRLLNEN